MMFNGVFFLQKMVRCTSKTVSGKRCKLHCVDGGKGRCAIHSTSLVPIQNTIIENTIIENIPLVNSPPPPSIYIQSQAELLVEKKVRQRIWKSLVEPAPFEPVAQAQEELSNLIVSIHESDELPCGHSCTIGAADKCCGCADTRPRDSKYMRYVEGVGDLNVGLREDDYCSSCKGYWATAMPIHERYNCIMNTAVPNNVAPALGAYGLEFCKEIQETIGWLVQMHNALYSRSVELSMTEETSSTDVNINSPF